ncbi:hypothetical protein KL86APRO_11338 [uncultured Alphaproteobacteria bacterium]|uniref:Uncharacterized protein n=1 Tax=uncultured Alphaproteobacteria bacterium TaxID=91750 RepID=A0A212JMV4_9PROT|nr:hypothetical protein KL86APRO_11338 [uncultured Alphaproteobacteria bacterium]
MLHGNRTRGNGHFAQLGDVPISFESGQALELVWLDFEATLRRHCGNESNLFRRSMGLRALCFAPLHCLTLFRSIELCLERVADLEHAAFGGFSAMTLGLQFGMQSFFRGQAGVALTIKDGSDFAHPRFGFFSDGAELLLSGAGAIVGIDGGPKISIRFHSNGR